MRTGKTPGAPGPVAQRSSGRLITGCALVRILPGPRLLCGAIVYRLGRGPFKAERRVRFPLALRRANFAKAALRAVHVFDRWHEKLRPSSDCYAREFGFTFFRDMILHSSQSLMRTCSL